MSKTVSLEITETINAPRAKVFKAWTNPSVMRLWYAPDAMTVGEVASDPRPGGRYLVEMKGKDVSPTVAGEYVEVVENERLVFTWRWQGDDSETTLVTVTFEDAGKGTKLTLLHERFASAASRDRHEDGWQRCLAKLPAAVAA